MTQTKRKYLVRRIVASAILAVLLAVGLARAFAGGSSSAVPDKAASLVPANALIYLNLGTSKGATQWKHTTAAMSKLPLAGQLRDGLIAATTSSTLGRLTLDRDVKPWLGDEAAYAELPGTNQNLLLFRARDTRAAQRSISAAAGSSPPETYRGTLLRDVGGGSLATVSGGWALIGARNAVHAALDLRAKPAGSLARNSTYSDLVGGLPNDRVGSAWLSQQWMSAHLSGPTAILAGLARVPSLQSAAVGFGDDGKLMRLAFRARPAAAPTPAPGCSGQTSDTGALFSKAPAHPALFVGMAGAECVLRDLMASPTSTIGTALQSFAAQAQREGVNLDRDVLPLLGGDSGLSVTPGPTITLDAGDVPAQPSLNVLGRLQPALIRLLNPEAGGVAPTFGAQNVNGVTAMTASLTPGLQLSYAAFDGDLLVSSALNGIAEARKGDHLAQTKDFNVVLGQRPKAASALVFLDLEKLLALADQAGLGSNPTYAAVRDDLQKIGAAGGVLSREGNDIDAELRLKNP
jgi:hypothetical protein